MSFCFGGGREVVGNLLQCRRDGFFDFAESGQFVIQVDEKDVDGAGGRHWGIEYFLVETEVFPYQSFYPVAFDSAFEFFLAYADGNACGVVSRLGGDFIDDAEGIFDKAQPRRKEFTHKDLAAKAF